MCEEIFIIDYGRYLRLCLGPPEREPLPVETGHCSRDPRYNPPCEGVMCKHRTYHTLVSQCYVKGLSLVAMDGSNT